MSTRDSARVTMMRIEELALISEEPGKLTRTFGSKAMREANELVGSWMTEAGMKVRVDAIGNLIGSYTSGQESDKGKSDRKFLILGSHLDTVRDAGKFDGPLGVLTAIACVEELRDSGAKLPFGIEVVGFADEEGVRFQSTYLGSKVLAGTFEISDLRRKDFNGKTIAEAIRDFGGQPDALGNARINCEQVLGYAEVHIEQGPVLEEHNLAVGVVTGIAGQTRAKVTILGCAGHAGTTPMSLRQDALCAAAEFVLAVEAVGQNHENLVATAGQLTVNPGASNVIPGEVTLSLDLRHPQNSARQTALNEIRQRLSTIAEQRSVRADFQLVQETNAVICDPSLTEAMSAAVKMHQVEVVKLASGAGHDAAAIASIAPVTMLFVRCKRGVSHHPDESAAEEDVRVAIRVLTDFVRIQATRHISER